MKDMAFREQKQHGSLDFPVGYYCVDPQYYQYVMPLHWHREPELVQVRRGTLRIYLNSVLYTLRQGGCAVYFRRCAPPWRAGGLRLRLRGV